MNRIYILMGIAFLHLLATTVALGLTIAAVWQFNALAGQAAFAWAAVYLLQRLGTTSALSLLLEKKARDQG